MRKILLLLLFISFYTKSQEIPESFIDLKKVVPNLIVDLRYSTTNNFMGKPIDGYITKRAIGTIEMADKLKIAQKTFNSYGLGIKIFDAYRPQKAVNHFIRWSKIEEDTINKTKYYPDKKI